MTRLIVTADDLGLHRSMTDGALHAHHHGIVTACSVSPCGADFENAADRLGREPALDVGVHFTLVEERPISDPRHVPTLTTSTGTFPKKWPRFLARFAAGRIDLAEVEAELRAQLARALESGLSPTHLNSHQHLHLLPPIRTLVERIAREHGIPYVRRVRESSGVRPTPRSLIFALLSRVHRHPSDLRSNDWTIGVVEAGRIDAGRLEALLEHARETTEIVAHPGLDNASLGRAYDWGYDWESETAALCAPRVRETIARRGIELTRIDSIAPR